MHVGFGAPLERTFTLRRPSGRAIAQIPMIGTRRSGYYIHAISVCPAWIKRVEGRMVGKSPD